jgi:hypothetical protein
LQLAQSLILSLVMPMISPVLLALILRSQRRRRILQDWRSRAIHACQPRLSAMRTEWWKPTALEQAMQ